MMTEGTNLLAAYRASASEDAFAQLVRRYANLVYSVAKRRLSSSALAEEVSQTVFMRLAKSAPKLKSDAELMAWLHRTAVHVSIDVWRSETHREAREEMAATMQPATAESKPAWEEIAPHLDEALNELAHTDRQAVLLRYFERKPLCEVGNVLGVSEDAAKMRVSRALDRLRKQLTSRGIGCTAVGLAALIPERSMEAVPAHVVTSLSATKYTATAGSGGLAFGTLLQLISFMSKAKIATALVAAVAVGIGLTAINRASKSDDSANDRSIAPEATRQSNQGTSSRDNRFFARRTGSRDHLVVSQNVDDVTSEDAKSELRALLLKPNAGGSYPPRELVRVLAKFGDRVDEALPILLEALGVNDYETRAWAVSGVQYALNSLQTTRGAEERAEAAFALARPALSQILKSPNEPDLLRMVAVSTYLPTTFYADGQPKSSIGLGEERIEDFLAALYTPEKKSKGFRFTIAGMLNKHFANRPEDAATIAAALRPLLKDSRPYERLLAAFALASWPGEKPPEVKEVLLAEVLARTTVHSYRAASGLGKLGAQAADTVPALLAYAEAMKDASSGYSENALESACRLQPELRTQYPNIDAKLNREEAMFAQITQDPRSVSVVVDVAATLADPEKSPALLETLISGIRDTPHPEVARAATLAMLEHTFDSAPEDQRAAIQSAMDAVRQTEISPKKTEPKQPLSWMLSALTEARVLLIDSDNQNATKLERVVEQFQDQYRHGATNAELTTERFQELAKAFDAIDPDFQKTWREQLLQNYPWLDRTISRE